MSAPVISVRNLGKRYRLGATLRHDTLRDHLTHAIEGIATRWLRPSGKGDPSPVIGNRSSVISNPSSGNTTPTTDHRSRITDHHSPTPTTDHRSPVTDPPSAAPTIYHSPSTIHAFAAPASSPDHSPSTIHHSPQLVAAPGAADEFWALRDVSFDVHQGEVVGIIGRNGAGKSTLLKILSQITEPTTGEVRIRGRVASLLEVGTGFHPELSGRENIFLNGAILGMTRAEIKRKFDEIVAFAEVEPFIDTPVKRYSSGMYVRLAFAVAAHLEPEILVIDEVLAVGDAAFQRKCTDKMEDAATAGHTVLFVSHNLSAVRNLCPRAVWLQDGAMVRDGETGAVADAYLGQNLRGDTTPEVKNRICALPADADFCLTDVTVTQDGTAPPAFANGKPIRVEIRYTVSRRVSGLRVYFDLLDDDQDILIRSFHDSHEAAVPVMNPGRYLSVAEIPAELLAPRRYDLRICAGIFNVRSCMGDGILLPLTVYLTSGLNRAYPSDPHRAKLEPEIPWETIGLA